MYTHKHTRTHRLCWTELLTLRRTVFFFFPFFYFAFRSSLKCESVVSFLSMSSPCSVSLRLIANRVCRLSLYAVLLLLLLNSCLNFFRFFSPWFLTTLKVANKSSYINAKFCLLFFFSLLLPCYFGCVLLFSSSFLSPEKKNYSILCVYVFIWALFYCPIIINYNNNNNSEYCARHVRSFFLLEKQKKKK